MTVKWYQNQNKCLETAQHLEYSATITNEGHESHAFT
jgi:hypothetical protein